MFRCIQRYMRLLKVIPTKDKENKKGSKKDPWNHTEMKPMKKVRGGIEDWVRRATDCSGFHRLRPTVYAGTQTLRAGLWDPHQLQSLSEPRWAAGALSLEDEADPERSLCWVLSVPCLSVAGCLLNAIMGISCSSQLQKGSQKNRLLRAIFCCTGQTG